LQVATIAKKVCLLGDFAVGKTSLVRRFVYNLFDDRYISTIGVKVSRKILSLPSAEDITELSIMLWDLAGSEEFGRVRSSYLRGAAGAVLVCDLTRAATLENLQSYAENVGRVNSQPRLVVAANKRDLADQRQISAAQLDDVATSLDAPYYLTSAKTGEEVERMFRRLGQLLLA
jgi:small GTP-binding protein